DKYYDVYNSAFQVDTNGVQLYHKSKLVVGVEMLPYPQYLKFVKKLSVNLGGSSGGLGTQEERATFISDKDEEFKVGPIICYESIYGEFVTEYVHKGANMLFIITNDGWWRNTPGHRQHLHYARLRAIETRRSIARSANTGISAIINQRGELEQRSSWWVRTALLGTINANDKITPYVKWGDSIGRLATFITILIAIYAISRKLITFRSTNKKS
ncbi:MAG: apolipoprotein N-acyltransferase, partial [Prevotellaceae bacterium]|nr:apolipoprotein N-acyltransferase [Prevotellaceae bacterium]